MKLRILTYCLVNILFYFSLSFAQVLPDSNQIKAWQTFNELSENKWTLRWDEQTGTPAVMYGPKSISYSSIAKPEEAARKFLKEYSTIFNMKSNLSDLSEIRSQESNGVHVIDFQQEYEGIPVLGAEYSVAVGKENEIQMAAGKYFRTISCNTTPTITSEKVMEINLKTTEIKTEEIREFEASLVIYPKGNNFFLTYRVWLNQWELIIDALDGKVIDQYERICRIDGTGNVYPNDPVNSTLTTVTIPRLIGNGYILDGTYVKSTNAESGDAYSATRDFRYTPPYYTQHDGTHFDDVNVYYHIDKFASQYWSNIGYTITYKVNASVHDPYPFGHDNAAASASSLQLWFGHGQSIFWDLAKKEDVINHEYTHIVSGQIGLGWSGETSALNEGYSDYHAATFTNQHQIGEWVTRNFSDLRTLVTSSSTFNYNNYNQVSYNYPLNPAGSAHANSMIWSGALWDLRNTLGPTITNFLAYQGLVYRHGYGTKFLDARDGIIIADQNFYGGSHINIIKNVFCNRGITFPGTPQNLTLTGGVGDFPTLSWTANTECNLAGYKIYRRFDNPPLYDLIATVDESTTSYVDRELTIGDDPEDPWASYKISAIDDMDQESSMSNAVSTKIGGINKDKAAQDEIEKHLVRFELKSIYPNPFNPTTTITYNLPNQSKVLLKIYDILGREVAELVNETKEGGSYSIQFNARNLASGLYILTMKADDLENGQTFTKSQKLLLTK